MQKTNRTTIQHPMKTTTKLALTGLVTAMFATGALANDGQWVTFQNGNTTATYWRPAPTTATVAVNAHGKGVGQVNEKANQGELRVQRFQTANGYVSYLAPAE
jgi:hypothetical protein